MRGKQDSRIPPDYGCPDGMVALANKSPVAGSLIVLPSLLVTFHWSFQLLTLLFRLNQSAQHLYSLLRSPSGLSF